MKKDIKKLIISIFIVFTILLIIDIIVGKCGDFVMTKLPSYSGQIAKDNYRLNRLETDIVIIGSSRGSHHYVTTVLGDSINKYTNGSYSIYNAAIDGKFINSNSCAAESIIKRYTPDMLIFEVGASELKATGNEYSDIRFSLPHYTSNETVRSYINELGWKERIKAMSNIYRYNGKVLRIISSFLIKGNETGYEPLFNKMKVLPNNDVKEKKADNSPYSVENFTRVLETCKNNNINLVVVSSPRFRPIDNNYFLKELCKKHNITYIDLYDLGLFNENPELFQDGSHLNHDGALIYTKLFFENLKPYLNHLILE